MKKATHQQTKQHNRDLILRTIFEHDSISRADVARLTNLTRTTVSDVVNVLLSEGLVQEVGRGESIGGKSPILLSLVADSRYVNTSMQTGAFFHMAEDTKLEIGKLDYRACILGASAFLLLDDYSLLFHEEN